MLRHNTELPSFCSGTRPGFLPLPGHNTSLVILKARRLRLKDLNQSICRIQIWIGRENRAAALQCLCEYGPLGLFRRLQIRCSMPEQPDLRNRL